MPTAVHPPLQARKSPVQARSTASVDAILPATVQVLLQVGAERLTTTRVAQRAGVSVGTLYQYFPNKSSLLHAVLRRHLQSVSSAIQDVCRLQAGKPLVEMASALVNAFLDAKLQDVRVSLSLYQISADLDAIRIVQELSLLSRQAVTTLLESSPQPIADPSTTASTLLGAMYGISRQLLETGITPEHVLAARRQLTTLATSFLNASTEQ